MGATFRRIKAAATVRPKVKSLPLCNRQLQASTRQPRTGLWDPPGKEITLRSPAGPLKACEVSRSANSHRQPALFLHSAVVLEITEFLLKLYAGGLKSMTDIVEVLSLNDDFDQLAEDARKRAP